jgi:CRP/FNR family cyclic AMP-dependent transcriptional regulator
MSHRRSADGVEGPRLDADTSLPGSHTKRSANWLASALPEPMYVELVDGSKPLSVAAGEPIISPDDGPRTGMLLGGIARAFLTAADGRQLTVRYVRPGSMIGAAFAVAPERAPLRVEALTDCEVLELDIATLRRMTRTHVEVAWLVLAELNRRLFDLHTTLAANAFGTMRERIARHLLDLSGREPNTGELVVAVTQQQLADSVGTVREVVARVLRDLREEGVIATMKNRIEVVDAGRLASVVGRWHGPSESGPPNAMG